MECLGSAMAHLHLNPASGMLIVVPAHPLCNMLVVATTRTSRPSTHDDARAPRSLPPGRWKAGVPGEQHPSGGILRPDWIPIGPIPGGIPFYFIPAGQWTEHGIVIPSPTDFAALREILTVDRGGVLEVAMVLAQLA